jgi:hypothetical protein
VLGTPIWLRRYAVYASCPESFHKPLRLLKARVRVRKTPQIARFKERVSKLEQQVRELQRENELLSGKLTCQ